MTKETYWFRKHWWSFYTIHMAMFQIPALIVDGLLLFVLFRALDRHNGLRLTAMLCLCIWILSSKLVKLVPHFIRHPEDACYIPASILFSYFHGVINVWALFTLHITKWGSRKVEGPEIDTEDEFSDIGDEKM